MSEYSPMDTVDCIAVPIVVEAERSPHQEDIIQIIDNFERQVEFLRAQAGILEEVKDNIVTSLDTLRQSTYVDGASEVEREDILLKVDRLSMRVSSVDVSIRTVRDELQEESLSQINDIINRLVGDIDSDSLKAKAQCVSFINTCVSNTDEGATDKSFEMALLGCTLDDQKRIHKRLTGLLSYLERQGVSFI